MKPSADPATLADWLARRPAPAAGGALAAVCHEAGVAGNDPELIATLDVLASLAVDEDTLAAAIAQVLPSGAAIPAAIAALVEGEREAQKVWALHRARGTPGGAEGLRRLLLAIIGDLRVVFILLARQLVRLRNAGATLAEPGRRALAELTADIHAPLANRLGIWQLKWEMEDLAFRHLQPEVYRRIAKLLALAERPNEHEAQSAMRQAQRNHISNIGQAQHQRNAFREI